MTILQNKRIYVFLIGLLFMQILFYIKYDSLSEIVVQWKMKINPLLDQDIMELKYNNIISFNMVKVNNDEVENQHQQQQILNYNSTNLILYYTTVFNRPLFKTDVYHEKECPSCQGTMDRDKIKDAKVVYFHGGSSGDLPKPHLMPMHLKPPGQKWVFHSMEAAINHGYCFDNNAYDGMFEWISTHQLYSDFPSPYGSYVKRKTPRTKHEIQHDLIPAVNMRPRMIMWMVSNCGASYSPRNRYVNELSHYIAVDIFGKCSTPIPRCSNADSCLNFKRKYKFYLSFENSLCDDYVTEKYWSIIQEGIIPIVMGGANYSKVAIPGSYIDTNWFNSPKELANYLKLVAKNDTLYQSYFQWKDIYKIGFRNSKSFFCLLCDAINDKKLSQSKARFDFTASFGPNTCKRDYGASLVSSVHELKHDNLFRCLLLILLLLCVLILFYTYIAMRYLCTLVFSKRTNV